MIGKSARLAGILGAAVGVPFVAMNEDVQSTAVEQYESWFSNQTGTGSNTLLDFESFDPSGSPTTFVSSSSGQAGPAPSLSGSNLTDFSEVFRLDRTTAWITQRWSRISTVRRGSEGYRGMRVPLVTGTQVEDIAGSLTYHFDGRQILRRITFHGTTGDPRKLVTLISQRFGLYSEPSLGAGLYLARWNGEPTSVLSITHASVLRADAKHTQFNVVLELNRPDIGFRLSDETKKILAEHGQMQN